MHNRRLRGHGREQQPAASERRGRLDMSNPQERPAGTPGTSGSTMGYEQGQAQARGQEYEGQSGRNEAERGADRGYAPAGRRGEHRGTVVTFTAVGATLMVLAGLWGVIVGLAALSKSHIYWANPGTQYYYYWTNHGWGWVELILGIVVAAVGVSV